MSTTPVRDRRRPAPTAHEWVPPAGTSSSETILGWARHPAVSLEHRLISELKPAARNARRHSKKQIEQIAASIRAFGFVNPILVDAQGEMIAGHGRLAAARELGLDQVPVIRLDHLTPEQVRAYRLADNRLAELSDWDPELLAIELGELIAMESDFEIEVTGFDTAAIDIILADGASSATDDPDDDADVPEGPPVSRIGDLWLLGPHRLLCGDARERAAYDTLLGGETAQMVFTDPPYNVPIAGHVSGKGRVTHREFAMASGEMSQAQFTAFLATTFGHLARSSTDGSIHFICMDWRHIGEMLAASRDAYGELKNLCVWNKDNAGMGSFYRAKHELVFVFKNGRAPHINNFGLGQGGRYRTNVWDYPGLTTLKPGRAEELSWHPTVKPVAMVVDAIKDCSKRRGLVLDPFGGSGTTLIAAERTGRRGYLMELDPLYVDVAVRRWQKLAGVPARHAVTGASFDEISDQRRAESEVRHG